ncbi:hypothetical protein HOG98_04610 [bacterium]|jgi:chromosome segregation ATPase|nr:hypothetical protein [bacterium]
MIKTIKKSLLLVLFACNVVNIYGQEIKLSVSPSPAPQGSKIRVALQSDTPLLKVTVKNKHLSDFDLKSVEDGLFSQTTRLSKNHPVGKFKAIVTIITLNDKLYEIPLEYTVVKENSATAQQAKEFGGKKNFKENEESKLNSQIDFLQDSVDLLEKDKKNLNKKIEDLKKEIENLRKNAKDTAKLLKKQKELEDLRKKLKDQEDSLNKRNEELGKKLESLIKKEKDLQLREFELTKQKKEIENEKKKLSEKSTNLQTKEKEIKKFESKLQESERDIKAKEKTLGEKASGLSKFKAGLDVKEQDLENKEESLEEFQEVLETKNLELISLTASLDTEKEEIETKRQALNSEKTKLSANYDELDKEKEWIILEKQSVESLESEIKKQTANFYTLKKAEQTQLLAKRTVLRERNAELYKVEETINLRQAELEDQRFIITKQEEVIEKKERDLENTKSYIETLKKDLEKKYDEMLALKDWLDNKQLEIENNYQRTKKETNVSEKAFVEEFEKLESLSRLLQKKSNRVMAMNDQLMNRNSTLRQELETVAPPEYRFGFSPYVGAHIFNEKRDLESNLEAGLKFSTFLKNNWFFETQIGFVPTTATNSSEPQTVTTYGLNINYEVVDTKEYSLHVNSGFGGDFSESGSSGINIGTGFKYKGNKRTLRVDTQIGTDVAINIGFEKKLEFESFSLVKKEDLKEIKDAHVVSAENVEFIVSVPEEKIQYQFEYTSPYIDMHKHWAKGSINMLDSIGIYEKNGTANFRPKEYVTHSEIAKVLVTLSNLEKALNQSVTKVKFSIIDLLRLPYDVDIVVNDEKGNLVQTLVENKKYYPGEYNVEWNGKNHLNMYVNDGIYTIESKISDSGVTLNVHSDNIIVINRNEVKYRPEIENSMVFEDVSESDPNRPYIQQAIRSELLYSQRDPSGFNFEPNKTINRLDFILATSRLLSELGAPGKVTPDLSPYRDIKHLSNSKKKLIGLYINELGYGGDQHSRLLPYRKLTRAELAVITNRILIWQLRQPYLSFPESINKFVEQNR